MSKTATIETKITLNLNEEYVEETIDCLSYSLRDMIHVYETARNTKVAYLLFTGNFKSCYDSTFSGEGGSLIPYSDDNDSLLSDIILKLDQDADYVTLSIDNSVLTLNLDDHDGTILSKLTLVTEKLADARGLDNLLINYPRSLAIKKLMGTTQPKGTRITHKMNEMLF